MNEPISLPATTVWHIFGKDWRLLWPLAVTTAILQALLGLLTFRPHPYSSSDLEGLAVAITVALAVSLTLLIVLAVQQDAVPSVNQDWLVRPIKRRDLLLAKLLAVALLIHGPIVLVDVMRGLGEGFGFGQMVAATLRSAFEIALVYTLPVMTIAALSKSVTEAVLVALALVFGAMLARLLVLVLLFPSTHVFHFVEPTDGTGVAWVWESSSHVLLLGATAAALVSQYVARRTWPSRGVLFGGLLSFMLIPSLPWRPAFAIQQWLSANSQAGDSVTVAVEPAGTGGGPESGGGVQTRSRLLTSAADDKEAKTSDKAASDKNLTPLFLTLRVRGLPDGTILHADHSTIRVLAADGATLYRGSGDVFDVRGTGSDGQLRQSIQVPTTVYRRLAKQAVKLQADYSLTLFEAHALPPLAAIDGDLRNPQVGHCASRTDPEGNGIEVSCLTTGQMPPCISMEFEENRAARGEEHFECTLNYQPALLRFSEEPLDDFKGTLPLPAAPIALAAAHVVLRVYEPQAHIAIRVVVPDFSVRGEGAPPK